LDFGGAVMKILALLVAAMLSASVHADQTETGTTAATFIKLGTGARAIAMGEAYVALSGDSNTLSYNPAGMAGALSDIELTQDSWFEGANAEDLSGLMDLGSEGSFGANINYLSIPNQQVTERIAETADPTQNFAVIGSFTPYDTYGTVSYANSISKMLDYGVSLKASQQSIDGDNGVGLGADIGLISNTAIEGLVLGASIQNLGLPVKLVQDSFNLPEIVRFGTSYTPLGKGLVLSAEFDMPNDAQSVLALGIEYNLGNTLYPRFGYRFDGIFNPWSAGFGFKIRGVDLDLATVPYGDLGQTYRATVSYRFGVIEPTPEPTPVPTPVVRKVVLPPQAGEFKISDPDTFLAIKPQVADADKVIRWVVTIFDASGKVILKMNGKGPVNSELDWNGYLDGGKKASSGTYWLILAVKYSDGKVLYSNYDKLTLSDISQ
jgi:hypothetical protein